MVHAKEEWESFVNNFNLQDVKGDPVGLIPATIYFKPSCEVTEPSGVTADSNLGVMAKFSVLVK